MSVDQKNVVGYPVHSLMKLGAGTILENPLKYDWSLQGFGMLRHYVTPELRLHVWDSRYQVKDVSNIHTHPWDFVSYVIAGEVHNIRYHEVDETRLLRDKGMKFNRQTIKCGEGGGLEGSPTSVLLSSDSPEYYKASEVYTQKAFEIHSSLPLNGTVTLIYREFLDDTEHAYVYFEGDWVTAESRKATEEEVIDITKNALERWF